MLCGCETSLLGEWNGTCIFADVNQESVVDVTNTVERDNGYLLEGTMELYTWEDDSFTGEMIGDHNGKYVCFRGLLILKLVRISFESKLNVWVRHLKATASSSPDGVGALVGSIGLER